MGKKAKTVEATEATYADLEQVAEGKGALTPLATRIFRFEEPGDRLVGRLLEIGPFKESQFEQSCHKYVFDTDDGRVSCVLGSATDQQLADKIRVGQVLRVIYQGKATTAKGQQCNQFDVALIQETAE